MARTRQDSVIVRAFLPSTKMLVKHLALPRLLREMLRLTSILDLKVLCTDLKTTRGSSKGLARHQTLSAICSEQHMPRHLKLKKMMKKQ
ncbi:hypothetical protein ACS0PU_003423 [Formica fusca]